MQISDGLLIGGEAVRGTGETFRASNPATGELIGPEFSSAPPEQIGIACVLAHSAFHSYRSTSLEVRASFLETIAQAIIDLGDDLMERTVTESGLPRPRIEGERGRTVGQLRLIATVNTLDPWRLRND